MVVSESRRRWALAAAVAMGPDDCPPTGRLAMLFERPKRSWNVWLVMEARRRTSGE